MSDAATVLERCERLGRVSEEPARLTRRFGTAAMAEAAALVGSWMDEAGLEVRADAVGNVVGRRAGDGPRALVLGSHLDTVVDAGRYDGPLGVLAAIACAERLRNERLPFALEVAAFADEEGVRFGTGFLGSAAMTGAFDPAWLALRDPDGVALGDLLPGNPADAAREPGDLLGYCEVHIEQGPVLEARNLPVGVVTGIAGQSHADVALAGRAGHAGTVPMAARRDALCGAAELVLAVEDAARDGVLATVGGLRVRPGARNVIPAAAELVLDVRHAEDPPRRAAVAAIRRRAGGIAAARGLDLAWADRGETPAVALSRELADALAAAVAQAGVPVARLPSGAGHDAGVMARITPAAMLFVRCRGGISHHPDEAVEAGDVAVALDVLESFVRAR